MSDLTSEEEERLLRMELMRADIELKREQTKWEPWKAMAAAFAAGAALFGAVLGAAGTVLGYLLASHR